MRQFVICDKSQDGIFNRPDCNLTTNKPLFTSFTFVSVIIDYSGQVDCIIPNRHLKREYNYTYLNDNVYVKYNRLSPKNRWLRSYESNDEKYVLNLTELAVNNDLPDIMILDNQDDMNLYNYKLLICINKYGDEYLVVYKNKVMTAQTKFLTIEKMRNKVISFICEYINGISDDDVDKPFIDNKNIEVNKDLIDDDKPEEPLNQENEKFSDLQKNLIATKTRLEYVESQLEATANELREKTKQLDDLRTKISKLIG